MPFGEGSNVLDLEDFIISNNLLPLGSLIYLAFCTTRYGWGFENFMKEANEGKGIKFPRWVRGICDICPASDRAGNLLFRGILQSSREAIWR